MSDVKPKRERKRTLKTWSAFGDLGRRPSEYEIVTHNLNHTTGPAGLEMGPDVHGNVWLREHRDSMKVTVPDWDAFRDPDAMTYNVYVGGQDDQETYVEGLLEQFDEAGHDENLSPEARALLFRAFTPSRFLAHGLQMLSAYVQQLAVSSYVSNCAVFQTADMLRRLQTTAYRTKQLQLTHGDAQANGDRWHWEGNPLWQPFRKAVELALVEYDWDRAFVITNLVIKPVTDLLTLGEVSRQAAHLGAQLDAQVLENLYRDSRRSQRWTSALVDFLIAENADNQAILQGYLDEFAPLAEEIIAAGAELIAVDGGRSAEQIATAAREQWSNLLVPLELRLGDK
ncbi:toluene hydroxylase [Nocardioides sp. WS12]|uniref:toluene hydroxylase n=1 Tax=Nocardioides sp. WS12 TaxID=2486272 RepID=UPI0015FA48FD|nr:toluene hydroxylase [Nocardioides sp. WS12]